MDTKLPYIFLIEFYIYLENSSTWYYRSKMLFTIKESINGLILECWAMYHTEPRKLQNGKCDYH